MLASRKEEVLKSAEFRDVRYFVLYFDTPNNIHDRNPETPVPEIPQLEQIFGSLEENEHYKTLTLEDVFAQSKNMEVNPGESFAQAYENSVDEEENLLNERNEQSIPENVFKQRKEEIIHKRNRILGTLYKRVMDQITTDVAQKKVEEEKKRLEQQEKEETARKEKEKNDKKKRPPSVKSGAAKNKKASKEELEELKKQEEEEAQREKEREEEEQRQYQLQKEEQMKLYEQTKEIERKENEQGLRPHIYFVLRDYPETVDELEALREAGANFDTLVVISNETKPGPPPKSDTELEDAIDSKNKDPKKKKGGAPRPKSKGEAKARPKSRAALNLKKKPQKGDKKKNQPTVPIEYEKFPPLSVALREKQDKLRLNNIASPLRDILIVDHKYFEYTYDENTKPFDDGEDANQETARIITSVSENIPSILRQIPIYRDDQEYKSSSKLTFVQDVEGNVNDTDMAYYHKLLHSVPEVCMTVPVILHCMVEQVVRNVEQQLAEDQEKKMIIDDKKLLEFDDRISTVLDGVFAKYNQEENQLVQQQEEKHQVMLLPYGNRTAESSLYDCTIQDAPLTKIENKMHRLFPVFYSTEPKEETEKQGPPPIQSLEERGTRLTELFHFMCSNPNADTVQNRYMWSTEQMEKELCLFHFEEMLPNSNFRDRIFREDFDAETFVQVLTSLSMLDKPMLTSNFYDMEDAAMIICHRKVPPCRFVEDSWYKKFSIRPYFMETLISVEQQILQEHYNKFESAYKQTVEKVKDLLTPPPPPTEGEPTEKETKPEIKQVFEQKPSDPMLIPPRTRTRIEQVSDARFVMEGQGAEMNIDYIQYYPSDGAFIHLTYQESIEKKITCNVQKDGVVFGYKNTIRNDGSSKNYFSSVFEDHSILTVQKEEETQLCYTAAGGLIIDLRSNGHIYQSFPGLNALAEHSRKVFGAGYQGLLQNRANQMTVKISPLIENIDIWDHKINAVRTVLTREINRCITTTGDIIRYFESDDGVHLSQVMCVNGQVHVLTDGYWLSKQNDGQLIVENRELKMRKVIGQILFAKNIDPDTKTTVHSREDLVMRVEYRDGTVLVQHADGTRIWKLVDQDKTTIFVKKDTYATVKLELLNETIIASSVECPDATIVKFAPEQSFLMFKEGHYISIEFAQHLLQFEPSSLSFVTNRNRTNMSRKTNVQGIYNFDYKHGGLRVMDTQSHEFVITGIGRSFIRFKGTPQLDVRFDQESSYKVNGLASVYTQGEPPKDDWVHPPRLFLLRRSDGSGCEFLSLDDVEPYIRTAKANTEATNITEDKFGEMKNISTLTFLTQYQSTIKESLLGNPEAKYIIPRAVTPLLEKSSPQPETVLYYRKLTQYPELQQQDRERMREGHQRWVEWYNRREQYNKQLQLTEEDPIDEETKQKRQQEEEMIKERIRELVERKQSSVEKEEEPPQQEQQAPTPVERQKQRVQSRAATKTPLLMNRSTASSPSRPLYWNDLGKKALEQIVEKNPKQMVSLPKPRFEGEKTHDDDDSNHEPNEESYIQDDEPVDDTFEQTSQKSNGDTSPTKITLKQLRRHQLKNTATAVVNEDYKRIEGDIRRKVNTVSTAINKQTTENEDGVNKDGPLLRVYPATVNFGHLPLGEVFSASVLITNYGNLPGRFHVKHLNKSTWFNSQRDARENSSMKVHYPKGPLAPGMSAKIEFEVHAVKPQKLVYDVEINTEQHVITVPVSATVISQHTFSSEKYQLNKKVRICTPTPVVHQLSPK
jgi:hypothetical protein